MRTTLPPPDRRFRVQWKPNLIPPERRLVLTRVYWNRGTPGDGKGYSAKVSLSLCWSWRRPYVGLHVQRERYGWIAWLCLLPCVPLRVHLLRSYGGSLF
jgi:hypothetical protein